MTIRQYSSARLIASSLPYHILRSYSCSIATRPAPYHPLHQWNFMTYLQVRHDLYWPPCSPITVSSSHLASPLGRPFRHHGNRPPYPITPCHNTSIRFITLTVDSHAPHHLLHCLHVHHTIRGYQPRRQPTCIQTPFFKSI